MATHEATEDNGLHMSSQSSLNIISTIETSDCNDWPSLLQNTTPSSASSLAAVYTPASPSVSSDSPINNGTGVCGADIIPPPTRLPERQFQLTHSNAAQEWESRKQMNNEASSVLDDLMSFQGLEEVKQHFLDIKSQVKVCSKQGRDMRKQRFNIVFQGSPGTGKTSIARLYAKFMYEMKLLPSDRLKETSGVKLAAKGAKGTKKMLKKMLDKSLGNDGGVLFVDEAYQLIADHSGQMALDVILTYMENHVGKLVVIFVGYKDDMEPFFEHNAGLSSRIPFTITFADFDDGQLWSILCSKADERYGGQMKVEGGLDGLYMRIAIRRLSQARGSCSFGNARAIENFLDRIQQRQVQRLAKQNTIGDDDVDCFKFTREDLIGPDPSEAARQCPAWIKLQKLIGIKQVKDNVERMIGLISANYKRELNEQKPINFSLNCLFVGAPGTGKTTVAKLYGKILADLGYLSRGDVIFKTPADFIGESLGSSEAKTKKILEATTGKVLVIDEAYMLDAGDPHKGQDSYKTGVIDTIVSIVQGMPGEDRCIILIGYEDRLRDMFQNMNPGLPRRFSADKPFRFNNFSLDELESILRHKLQNEELTASDDAIKEARDVLERALLRTGFSNAAEVDTLLATAKRNYEERQSQLPAESRIYDGMIEACDINPKSNEASPEKLDYHQRFGGRIHRSIIDRLIRYRKRYSRAKNLGLNTRENTPTRFIFKGSPGTGKSTTAQFMGEVFHDIGFLSTTEVIECSATDLLGQYVGQTAPKARKKLHESLGRVLFIDEAHRLLRNQFAAEALDELIYFLTLPANLGKVVVILAGPIEDIHQLMAVRPELSGLFPEDIVFEQIPPADCITLLERELQRNCLAIEHGFLSGTTSSGYAKVEAFFRDLQAIPGWCNARDVKNLSKHIIGEFLDLSDLETQPTQSISINLVLNCMSQTIARRKSRMVSKVATDDTPALQQPSLEPSQKHPIFKADKKYDIDGDGQKSDDFSDQNITGTYNSKKSESLPERQKFDDITNNKYNNFASATQTEAKPQLSGPAPITSIFRVPRPATSSASKGKQAVAPRASMKSPTATAQSFLKHKVQANSSNNDGFQASGSDDDPAGSREQEVPDAIWNQLSQAKKEERSRQLQRKAKRERLVQKLRETESENHDQLRAELMDIQKEIQDEVELQKCLQHMGVCTAGYQWTKVPGGYRCEGGYHFISDGELHAKLH